MIVKVPMGCSVAGLTALYQMEFRNAINMIGGRIWIEERVFIEVFFDFTPNYIYMNAISFQFKRTIAQL